MRTIAYVSRYIKIHEITFRSEYLKIIGIFPTDTYTDSPHKDLILRGLNKAFGVSEMFHILHVYFPIQIQIRSYLDLTYLGEVQ